jgi:hypothetical protein
MKEFQRIFPALIVLLAASASHSASHAECVPPKYIGDATMASDGVVTMRLRTTTDCKNMDGLFVYRPGAADYDEVLKRLGGLKPGETKLVEPWSK